MLFGGPISIRQLASTEQVVEVGEEMSKRYRHTPTLPFRSKAIVAFQKIDGVDVIVFVLYVHEFDGDCPHPNQNTVYISYLDSVKYPRPTFTGSKITTTLCQELIICYLDFARMMGITKAVVWSCPPEEGDDYILLAKPETQKIPTKKLLQKWYRQILDECRHRGICSTVETAYDHYFLCERSLTATDLPYFKHDYFQMKIEDIIAELRNEAVQDQAGQGQDEVMLRLAKFIVKNKDKNNIIIAFLESDEKSNTTITGANDSNDSIDIGIFDDRECFTKLCQDNNYQFDSLQRAKHTSMMILWRFYYGKDSAK